MPDRLLRIGSSVLQHGPDSDRVYVMKMAPDEVHLVLDEAERLAATHGYGKIVVKARASDFGTLSRRDFRVEAVVPHFHGGGDAGLFAGKYLDPERTRDADRDRIREVIETAEAAGTEADAAATPSTSLVVGEAGPEDADELAACYAAVFESYPFPIHDAAHLLSEREHGTRYFTVRDRGRLVAASSMEPGGAPFTVEMTDFATLPTHRRQGIATHLLALMDRRAQEGGTRVAYTIARACSFGMNITFGRRGYRYAGTLVNNTGIGGAIESMNVWYKILENPS